MYDRIVELVNHLRTYRSLTEEKEKSELERAKQDQSGTPYGDKEIREKIGHLQAKCEQLHEERIELGQLVILYLTGLIDTCPLIISSPCWHLHGVNWNAVDAELSAIEKAVNPK